MPPGGRFWEHFLEWGVGLLPPHLHGGVSASQFVSLAPGKERRRENAETESDEPASQPFLGFLSPEWDCSALNYWAPNPALEPLHFHGSQRITSKQTLA